MTIQEAIKSGRPFRRNGHTNWKLFQNLGHFLSREDILADDWEVEPEVIEFECEWWRQTGEQSPVYPILRGKSDLVFDRLIGKYTRVRIEVLP